MHPPLALGQFVRYQPPVNPNPDAVWCEVVSVGSHADVKAPSGYVSTITPLTRHLWQVREPVKEKK